MADLTAAEAQVLFNQTTKAIRDDDSTKLSELMGKQPDDVQVTIEPEIPAEEPEAKDDSTEVTVTEGDKPEETTPPDKAEKAAEEEGTKEPTELEKLQLQLDRLSKENHNLKSQAGRVPHVQRTLKAYDKKLDDLAKQIASPSSQPSTKIQPRIQELLKGVESADPELARAIADAIAAATNGVAEESLTKERDNIQFLRDQEANTYQAIEADRLLEMYPNAPEVFASKTWTDWKSEQPAGIRRLAEADNAEEVAYAFDKYAKDMVAKYPELSKVVDGTKSETPPVTDDAAERARQVEAERQRKKATAVTVANPTASGKVELPDDPTALFNKFADQIRKERTG